MLKRRSLPALALAIATLGGACVCACAKQPDTSGPVVLKIAAALPTERERRSGLTGLVDSLTTDQIVMNGADGRQLPHLATSWQWDEAHTRLTMQLRKDVKFHDGTPLTAGLVAQSLQESVARHESLSFSSIAAVKATAPDTLEIDLAARDSFLLADLGSTSVRRPGHHEVGTGPFRVVTNGSDKVVLDAFTAYYRGRPALDRIEVIRYPTQRKAWTAMMRSDVDVLHDVSRDAVEFVEAETSVRTFSFPRAYYIPLVFNLRHPALKNPAVRRAINMAVDRAALVKDGLRGRGRVADGPVWSEHWAYAPIAHPFSYDPESARTLLDENGWPVRPAAPGQMPSRFAFTCLVYADDTRFERIALVLQKQLYDIGIDMRLEPVLSSQFGIRAHTGNFDAFLIEMYGGKALSWVYAFWHSPVGQNFFIDTGYRAADRALDDLRHAGSDEETRAAVRELDDVLLADPPAAFLAWQAQARALSTRFTVPDDEPNRDVLSSIWQWRPARPQVARR